MARKVSGRGWLAGVQKHAARRPFSHAVPYAGTGSSKTRQQVLLHHIDASRGFPEKRSAGASGS